jgi:hypothetical protein
VLSMYLALLLFVRRGIASRDGFLTRLASRLLTWRRGVLAGGCLMGIAISCLAWTESETTVDQPVLRP